MGEEQLPTSWLTVGEKLERKCPLTQLFTTTCSIENKTTYYYVICTVLHVRFCIWMLNICIEGKFLFVLIAIEEIDISWL